MVGINNNGDANCNSFGKTICSICYEDLKPLTEDLQSISICGHVFHELCLQQWFEYCPNLKKRSCPICKQSCTNANVVRLYFQSVCDSNESSQSQKPRDYDESPEELRREVNRLGGKIVAMVSTLEQQQKECKEVKDQLLSCKDQLKAELAMKIEALIQRANSQQLLQKKSEELDKSALERTRLQERNMALAKELAALKLVSDLNLEEDEVLKLASLGNDVVSKETVAVLKKSLVLRNKSYKELMGKCNVLGRGEARCLQKLEKATDKIKKLQLRVQELETAFESKENEALRVVKNLDIKLKRKSHENTMKKPVKQIDIDEIDVIPDISLNEDEDITCSTYAKGSDNYVNTNGYDMPMPDARFDIQTNEKNGVSCSGSITKRRKVDQTSKLTNDIDDDMICYGDTNPVKTSLHVRNKIKSSFPVSEPGDHCFTGGLLGPDGTNWHLGKWCKKARGSNSRSGDLIAVGADGRGGQIKVMRHLDQSSLDIKDTSSWAKKSKPVTKPSKLQPEGHLKIEHFFQRTGQ
ncbi:hypothetical protein CASFOL_033572 [Castilleja foliolosa]|uniref:RING-type domain-containing protein n=1 Tax=Castilleja foliolosa TaxID=1961234 RepID=A0ABD3BXD2_9LAMI